MWWIAGFFLYLPNFAFSLQCLYCAGVVKPADCDTVIKCGTHEHCYLDAYISAGGRIRYDLGCRDTMFCGLTEDAPARNDSKEFVERQIDEWNRRDDTNTLANTAKRRSNGLLVCSECCSRDLCGSVGCGNTGYTLPRGPICFNCPYQQVPGDCSKITMCRQDQVCMLLKTVNPMTKEMRYSSKCEQKRTCDEKLQRFTEMSALFVGNPRIGHLNVGGSCIVQCCVHDLCNRDCYRIGSASPSILAENVTPVPVTTIIPTRDLCLSNPCMGGVCSIYSNTYRCTCRHGYWGRNCELVYQTFPSLPILPSSTTLETTTSPSTTSTHRTISTAKTLTGMNSGCFFLLCGLLSNQKNGTTNFGSTTNTGSMTNTGSHQGMPIIG